MKTKEEFKIIPNLVDKRGALRKSSVISYLYQHYEREVLDKMYSILGKDKILLGVHDCVYTKHNVNLLDMRIYLREISPYLNIDREKFDRYVFVDLEFHWV